VAYAPERYGGLRLVDVAAVWKMDRISPYRSDSKAWADALLIALGRRGWRAREEGVVVEGWNAGRGWRFHCE